MRGLRRSSDPERTGSQGRSTTEAGPGLARGPALIIGAILSAIGLLLFLQAGDTPTGQFPEGTSTGQDFLGIETNGWTAWFTTAAGALLLFGAAQHLLAKAMSMIVGLALAACVVIALIDGGLGGGDVLGLAATNFWTKLGWGIAAVVLLLNVFSPRINRERNEDRGDARDQEVRGHRAPAADGRAGPASDRDRDSYEPQDEAAAPERRRSGAPSSRTER